LQTSLMFLPVTELLVPAIHSPIPS
jgi:hypothetical protein